MITRDDLGRARAYFTEIFHNAKDQKEREHAFDMVLKINARLLRRKAHEVFPLGWAESRGF